MTKTAKLKKIPIVEVTKLDLGCGTNKQKDFHGVDSIKFDGVDTVFDLAHKIRIPKEIDASGNQYIGRVGEYAKWPWEDNSIEAIYSNHFIEHLEPMERVHFVNEIYRILKPGGQAQVNAPHWSSCRAYGDPTHKWAPISEFFFYYLSKEWRMVNAPHTDISNLPQGFSCDFDTTWGYAMHGDLLVRNQEYQMHAVTFWKEAIQDIISTWTAKK